MQPLVDSHIFVEAQKVVDALKAHDCGPALTWCGQHATKLKKIKSHRLEFKLRLQVCCSCDSCVSMASSTYVCVLFVPG